VFTANLITYNHVRNPCTTQYTFYRASFLIVINIHHGIETHLQERQILELRATDTGAASDRYWNCERHILESQESQPGAANDSHCSRSRRSDAQPQEQQILEPRATDTGAASDRYWSRREQQIPEPRATDTGAVSDRYWSCERQILEPGATTGPTTLRATTATGVDRTRTATGVDRTTVTGATGTTATEPGTTATGVDCQRWSHCVQRQPPALIVSHLNDSSGNHRIKYRTNNNWNYRCSINSR